MMASEYFDLALAMSRAQAEQILGRKQAPAKREACDFESQVMGIPCQVVVDRCDVIKGSHSYNASSDMDYYGYHEIEFHLLDSQGYRARWLEDKTTPDDIERIEREILERRDQE